MNTTINKHKINKYMPIYDNLNCYPQKIHNKNLVLITSKIIVSNAKWTYTSIRSTYTPEERAFQTFETIKSIRKYIDDCFIVLFDNSKLDKVTCESLKNKVDLFINITNDSELNFFTDVTEIKMYAETSQIMFFLDKYIKHIDISNVINFFKISGRYVINDKIDLIIQSKNNIFKKNDDVKDRLYYYTCFYKIVMDKFNEYVKANENIMEEYKKKTVTDLEVILPIKLNYDFDVVDNLCITQRIAVHTDITYV